MKGKNEQLMFIKITPLWFKKVGNKRYSYRHLELWDYLKNMIPIAKNFVLYIIKTG